MTAGEMNETPLLFFEETKQPEELCNLKKDPYEILDVDKDPTIATDLQKHPVHPVRVDCNDSGSGIAAGI